MYRHCNLYANLHLYNALSNLYLPMVRYKFFKITLSIVYQIFSFSMNHRN